MATASETPAASSSVAAPCLSLWNVTPSKPDRLAKLDRHEPGFPGSVSAAFEELRGAIAAEEAELKKQLRP